MAPPTGPSTRGLQLLAIPAVCFLVVFLGYYSQYIFNTASNLGTGPLSTTQTIIFNTLLACLWYTYYKACTVNPGVYPDLSIEHTSSTSQPTTNPTQRHCKKCNLPKPPRSHHCRHCRRCIPKMDHHCPWTGNCVSMQTFPHFLRFLVYANLSLAYLHYLIFLRGRLLWRDRHLPSYLGPPLPALITITCLALFASAASLALSILLGTTVRSWVLNMTMIEGWELERHEAVLDRYSDDSYNPDRILVERVEFPYDLGIYRNMSQAMGTNNFLKWFWPFAGGPRISGDGKGTGWEWEENGFNRRPGMWPPTDPDKARRWAGRDVRYKGDDGGSPEEVKRAFLRRQQEDFTRRHGGNGDASGILGEVEDDEELMEFGYADHGRGPGYGRGEEDSESDYEEEGMDGEPGWTNSDGDRLRDYGVDEDEDEFEVREGDEEDEDDVPIAELLRRRRSYNS